MQNFHCEFLPLSESHGWGISYSFLVLRRSRIKISIRRKAFLGFPRFLHKNSEIEAAGWTSVVRFPVEAEKGFLSSSPPRPERLWCPPSSHPLGVRDSSSGSKAAGRHADHSAPAGVEVKNRWSYTFTFQYVSMTPCLKKQGTGLHSVVGAFTFTFSLSTGATWSTDYI